MALLINGERIDDAVLDGEFSGIKAYFESLGNVSCCERNDEFRGYARQNVIARVLLAQEAMRSHPRVPEAEVEAAIAEAQRGERRRAAVLVVHRRRAGADGHHPPRRRGQSSRPQHARTARRGRPAADRCRTAGVLRTATSTRTRPPRRCARRTSSRPPPAASSVRRRTRRCATCGRSCSPARISTQLAKKHSDKADDHIDLGFFKRGELAEEFELVAFSMNVGEISPVFASPFGFHLVKVTERKPADAEAVRRSARAGPRALPPRPPAGEDPEARRRASGEGRHRRRSATPA